MSEQRNIIIRNRDENVSKLIENVLKEIMIIPKYDVSISIICQNIRDDVNIKDLEIYIRAFKQALDKVNLLNSKIYSSYFKSFFITENEKQSIQLKYNCYGDKCITDLSLSGFKRLFITSLDIIAITTGEQIKNLFSDIRTRDKYKIKINFKLNM